MEKIRLKMNYRGHCFYVNIDDTDRCLLIDVINDLYDEAMKMKVPLPNHPTLAYSFKMNYMELLDDKGLTEMFSRFEGEKVIDIWIGCGATPSTVLQLARNLRGVQEKEKGIVEIEKMWPSNDGVGRKKLEVTRNLIRDDVVDVIPSQNSIISQRKAKAPATQIVDEQPLFKLSKSTAKLKGVYVPKVKSTSSQLVQFQSSRSGTSRRKRLEYEVHHDLEDDSGTDNYYIPTDEEDGNDVEVSDLEVEDYTLISALDKIDDGYDPYETTEWSVDEEGWASKILANGEIYDDKVFGSIKLRPWMLFMDQDHFKDTLRDFCIQEGFHIMVVRADKSRYTAECATVGCEWRIHASVLQDGSTWAIKSIRAADHGCDGVRSYNPLANAEWVSKKLIEDIRVDPAISGESIQKKLMERYGLHMKKSSLYRMREKALELINGGHDESYGLLPTYCEEVKLTNPGSYAMWASSTMNTPEKPLQFKSIFVSFSAQFNGLIGGCRSLIGVDGTHLKGNHGGVLLSAVAVDGNNEIFPVAVGVVESENKESWSTFFWHLKQVLAESGREDWTIISDRQKGIEPALEQVWPSCYRRYCARHLCKNFKKDFPGILMHKLFWKLVNSYSEFTFKKTLESLVQYGGLGCGRWFSDLGDHVTWARYRFDPRVANDENTSNFVESFNSTLGIHRNNPVLSLLEGIRRTSMVRHATRAHIADSWPDDGICPKIRDRLKVLKSESRFCEALASSAKAQYEVRDGRSHLPVNLIDRTCKCGQWQISGIPCKHAIRAIITANKSPKDYVSPWFTVAAYKVAYGLPILPITDPEQWPTLKWPTLKPPTLRRSIGRPSRNRRREPGEQRKHKRSNTVKCKKCGCFGHNSKTCKGGYTAKEKRQLQMQMTSHETESQVTQMGEGSQSQSINGKKRKTAT